MEKEIDKSSDEDFEEIQDTDDTNWKAEAITLREKAIRQREKTKELRTSLKEYEAQIAEFEKTAKPKDTKSDEDIMKRLEKMALKMSNITEDDEVELYEKWKKDTGRDADGILVNKIFLSELADLRTTKANAIAADTKGGDKGKDSGGKTDPDYWIAKATKNSSGEMMFPDDMPNDFNLRAAIVDKMVASSKGGGQFYNTK